MKIVTQKVKVYNYDELSEKAQNLAVNTYITHYLEWTPWEHLSPKAKKACKKAEEMQTPWFTGSYYWEYGEKEILNQVKRWGYDINGNPLFL